ncbi:lipoyl domain-containing protein [Pusillimonas noertemannii]|uniref:lipoyl domain-containing protein n=1 Tax=Pusillimonas noertemannii TaxID=305977 RepID=UPI003342390E
MSDIVMSDEGWLDVEEGTEALLQEWHVKPGESVSEGQTVAIAELVKTTHEIMAPSAGVVADILVQAGDTFPRDAILAKLT